MNPSPNVNILPHKQFQNQEMNIVPIHRADSKYTSYTCIGVCAAVCNFITCVVHVTAPQSRHLTTVTTRLLCITPSLSHPASLPTISNPWKPPILLHFYNYVISWMLHKWKHVCIFLRLLGFFSLGTIWSSSKSPCVLVVYSLELLSHNPWFGWTTVCLTIHASRDV